MFHLQFLSLAMSLVNAASDGRLSLDEIKECVDDSFPQSADVIDAIEDAAEDGSISVMEVFDIVTTIIA